jgi:hypothetical protein
MGNSTTKVRGFTYRNRRRKDGTLVTQRPHERHVTRSDRDVSPLASPQPQRAETEAPAAVPVVATGASETRPERLSEYGCGVRRRSAPAAPSEGGSLTYPTATRPAKPLKPRRSAPPSPPEDAGNDRPGLVTHEQAVAMRDAGRTSRHVPESARIDPDTPYRYPRERGEGASREEALAMMRGHKPPHHSYTAPELREQFVLSDLDVPSDRELKVLARKSGTSLDALLLRMRKEKWDAEMAAAVAELVGPEKPSKDGDAPGPATRPRARAGAARSGFAVGRVALAFGMISHSYRWLTDPGYARAHASRKAKKRAKRRYQSYQRATTGRAKLWHLAMLSAACGYDPDGHYKRRFGQVRSEARAERRAARNGGSAQSEQD